MTGGVSLSLAKSVFPPVVHIELPRSLYMPNRDQASKRCSFHPLILSDGVQIPLQNNHFRCG
jgi:hypothetical protein